MIALLRKDLYVADKQMRLVVVLALVFSVIPQMETFGATYALVLAFLLPISTITYGWFLFGNSGLTVQFLTLLYLGAYLWFSYRLISGKSGKPVLFRLDPVSRPTDQPDGARLAK